MGADQNVRVVFVGVGSMGQCAHLRSYRTISGCDVVAIADLREKTAKRVAQRYEVPRVYTDFRKMFEAETFDAIVASQPFDRHGLLIPQLLEAKKPLFMEKPLAGTIESGEKVLEAVRRSGTWAMIGYHKRSDPAVEYAHDVISRARASGELGEMRYVRLTMPTGDWIDNGFVDMIDEGDRPAKLDTDPPARDIPADQFKDYTAFVNYYIHQVNLLRHLLGEPYRVTYAEPTGALLACESQSGVPCVIEMTPYRTTVDWQESALVAFLKGYVRVDLPAPLAIHRPGRVEVLRDPDYGVTPVVETPHLPWINAMRKQAMNFIAAVRGERGPTCDAAEALDDLKVAREYLRLWKGV